MNCAREFVARRRRAALIFTSSLRGASATKQSRLSFAQILDCFAIARNDELRALAPRYAAAFPIGGPGMTVRLDTHSQTRRLRFAAKFVQEMPVRGALSRPNPIAKPGGDLNAEILFQRRAKSEQGRAVSGRNGATLRTDPGRHPQGRAVQRGVPQSESERQGARDRR